MFRIFYWFFNPEVALAEWHGYMVYGIVASAVFIALGIAVYATWRYNRKRESLKFFLCVVGIVVFSIAYAMFRTSAIPDEICREGYKFRFGLSIVLATTFYSFLFLYIFSFIMGPKKYFARISEYRLK